MHGPRRGRRRGGPVDARASLCREWRREEVPSTSSSRFAHASSGLSRGAVETVVSPGARGGGRGPSAAPTTVGGRAHLPRRRKTLKEDRYVIEKLDFLFKNTDLTTSPRRLGGPRRSRWQRPPLPPPLPLPPRLQKTTTALRLSHHGGGSSPTTVRGAGRYLEQN